MKSDPALTEGTVVITVTVTELVAIQVPSDAVSVYVVVVFGFANGLAIVALSKPIAGLQE